MDEKPRVTWKGLYELYGGGGPLEISCPIPQHDARCHFSSPEEALVKLAVARYCDQKWEEKMFLELCKGDFDAALFLLGPGTAIACVRRRDPSIVIDSNAAWDDHMSVVLKFNREVRDSCASKGSSVKIETTVRTSGKVVSNQTSVRCEIVVLLHWIPPELYNYLRPLQQAIDFINLDDVYIEVNDKPAKKPIQLP